MKFDDLTKLLNLNISGYFIYPKNVNENEDPEVHGPFTKSCDAWKALYELNEMTKYVIGKFDNSINPIQEEIFERFLEDDELLDEEIEIDEASSHETRIRGGKRVSLKKYSSNERRDAEDRNFRVVDGKKQIKSNAKREHDRKKKSASDRWKNMSDSDRKKISKNIKKSMKKADRLHGNRGEKEKSSSDFDRIKGAAQILKDKKKNING